MAEGFKVNPRQVRETATSLPGSNAQAEFSKAMGGLADIAGGVAINVAVEKAAVQGAKERLEGKTREKLAPGITKATQSFNEAYADMDKNILYVEALNQTNASKVALTAPGAFEPGASQQAFKIKSDAVIANAVKQALPQNQAALAFELKKQQANDMLSIEEYSNKFVFQQGQKVDVATRESLLLQTSNAAQAGNEFEAKEHFDAFVNQLNDSVTTGFYTQEEADNFLEEGKLEILEATYRGEGQRAALGAPGAVEARAAELAREVESLGLTPEQADAALKAFIGGAQGKQSALASQRAIEVAQAEKGILDGSITQHSQLEGVKQKLTKLEGIELDKTLQTQINKRQKGVADVNSFRMDAFDDNGLQKDYKKDVKNAALAQDLSLAVARKADATQNPDATLTPQEAAQTVVQYNTPIPSWDSQQEAAILSNDFSKALPFLEAYRYQKNYAIEKKKNSSIGLKGDALEIADMFYQQAPQMENAADTYARLVEATRTRKNEVAVERRKEYSHIKEPVKRASFKELFDADPKLNDALFTAWKGISEDGFAKWGSNYIGQVEKQAQEELGQRWRMSRYGQPGVYSMNPIEAISDQFNYGELGNNNIWNGVYQAVQKNKALPADIRAGNEIEWALPQGFPESVTERELVEKNIPWHLSAKPGEKPNIYEFADFKDGPIKVFYQGEQAEVLVVTGGFSVEGTLPRGKFYIKKKNGEVVPWYDPYAPDGIQEIQMEPAKKIIPNTIRYLNTTSEQSRAEEIAEGRFEPTTGTKVQNAIDKLIPGLMSIRSSEYKLSKELDKKARKEKVKKESKKIKGQLEAKRDIDEQLAGGQ